MYKREVLDKFLREHLGMTEGVMRSSLVSDSDWALGIKLHAFVEATLNFAITKYFGDDRLEELISNLDIADEKRGKIAFVKALDLLPSNHRSFIRKFTALRNRLAHDAKNVNFDLKRYMRKSDPKKLKELTDSMTPLMEEVLGGFRGYTTAKALDQIKTNPRYAFVICTVAVMTHAYEKQEVRRFLTEEKLTTSKSNPKAQ